MTVGAARSPRASDVLAKARREDFPVASLLLPSGFRPHFINIYGFARPADDIGDEGEGDRLVTLDWLGAELAAAKHALVTLGRMERLPAEAAA
jgi:phytoene/squalene synthetase